MLVKRRHRLACVLSLGSAFLLPSAAHAVLCDDIALPNKVFGSGGSAVTATLKAVALAIANDPNGTPADQTTIFYTDPNACDGYGFFLANSTTRAFKYWIAGSTADQTCEARVGGQPLDFSHMGNAADLCVDPVIPAGVRDFPAPVQTVNIVTGLGSNETSISAEAIHFIYGYGPGAASNRAAPWTDGAGVFARQSTSFVTFLLGAHAQLPATAFVGAGKWALTNTQGEPGAAVQTNGAVITAVSSYSTDETKAAQALGYVSGSTADGARDKAKTLAFQAFGQTCGVYPDSTSTALDKLNVRRGKYALWAQGHYFARVNASGVPTNPLVANLIGWFDGSTKPPGTTVSAFDKTIKAGDIPACAMEALREGTAGAFYSYAPSKPCQGRYEFVATGSTVHDTCEADTECGGETPSCNFGYCEAYRAEGEEEG
jgi:hypothetical protein